MFCCGFFGNKGGASAPLLPELLKNPQYCFIRDDRAVVMNLIFQDDDVPVILNDCSDKPLNIPVYFGGKGEVLFPIKHPREVGQCSYVDAIKIYASAIVSDANKAFFKELEDVVLRVKNYSRELNESLYEGARCAKKDLSTQHSVTYKGNHYFEKFYLTCDMQAKLQQSRSREQQWRRP